MTASALAWSGLTHLGRFRATNEDAFLALSVDGRGIVRLGKFGQAPLATTDFIFAVSDGMGGAKSGEFASRIAVDRITRLVPRAFRLGAGGMSAGHPDLLAELFAEIHEDLLKLGASYEECAGMGATLSLAWFTPEWMYYGHVGDSRIYHLPAAAPEGILVARPLRQLTHDHTYVGGLRRAGQINEREARTHPRRNALQQALGAGQQFLEPQIGAISLNPGDRFLICSDGLTDGLWDRRIGEVLGSTADIADSAPTLVAEAVAASGRDNVTAVAVEVAPACDASSSTEP